MSRHVTHLLASYVEGQLSPRLEDRVERHTATCTECRADLARHERLHADLGLTLRSYLSPRAPMPTEWWRTIQKMPVRVERWRMSIVVPIMLAMFLVVMPLLGAESLTLLSLSGLEPTRLLPEVDITLEPPTSNSDVADTRIAADSTPVAQAIAEIPESHPTLARFNLPLIATPPSD